jgi:hypothetical protein
MSRQALVHQCFDVTLLRSGPMASTSSQRMFYETGTGKIDTETGMQPNGP